MIGINGDMNKDLLEWDMIGIMFNLTPAQCHNWDRMEIIQNNGTNDDESLDLEMFP